MLEDEFTDVVRKALKGHGLSPSQAALRAGLDESEVLAFTRGTFSADIARSLAGALGLNPDAFASLPYYEPTRQELPAIHRLDLPFGRYRVNSWLISENGTNLLFDTGDDRISCFDKLESLGIDSLSGAFITHAHPDHISGNAGLGALTKASYGPDGIPHIYPVKPEAVLSFGGLTVKVLDLSGHATPSFGYAVSGLPVPVLVVGDALFAGSMGGCPDEAHYRHALERLRAVLAEFPAETVILPGHGPATTLGEELERNPFPIKG